MSYRLNVRSDVGRYVLPLDRRRQRAVRDRVRALAADPFATAISKPLHGDQSGQWSSRVGHLRIIYEIDDVIRVVEVTDIGPRGDVYKR